MKLLAPLLTLALLITAAWHLVRELRPIAELGTIEQWAARGELERAHTELKRLLDRSPRHGDARRTLARVLAQQKDMRGCAEQLALVPIWWPGKRADLFMEGQAWMGLNLARRAERAWLACVQDDPLHPLAPEFLNGAAKSLVTLYLLEWRIEAARAVLKQAQAQAAPAELPAILATRMRTEVDRIEPREAAQTLSQYVQADRDDWDARLALARAENSAGNLDRANRLILECLDQRPHEVRAWSTWAAMLQERNDPAALAHMIQSVPPAVLASDDSNLQQARGVVLEAENRLEEAFDALRIAARGNPYDPEAHFRLARVAQRLGQHDVAETARARYRELRARYQSISPLIEQLQEAGRNRTIDTNATYEQLAEVSEHLGWVDLARDWRALKRP